MATIYATMSVRVEATQRVQAFGGEKVIVVASLTVAHALANEVAQNALRKAEKQIGAWSELAVDRNYVQEFMTLVRVSIPGNGPEIIWRAVLVQN